MDVLTVAKKINFKITQLEELKAALESTSAQKATCEAAYDKILAQTIIGLKNGQKFTLDGQEVLSPPISIIEKVAKGLCWKAKIDMDMADTSYRNTLKIIDITQGQMNGLQSINRYLSEV